ncbi:MAG TPA: hypothetical protein VFS20_04665 [Longimicrobium sp.]|nr:hypothetical protein [Longimicrobium sp.]
MTLLVHILAGSLAIITGYIGLFAAKGATLHRRSGTLFVYTMVVMGLSGAGIALARSGEATSIGGVLAAYLVVTALTTVRPPTAWSRRLDVAAMLVALAAGSASTVFALGDEAARDGIPAPMLMLFGVVGLLSGISDVRIIRSGPLRGTPRLRRHLWRMCFALWIATGSFFLGQADEFPEPLRIFPLLAIPAFLPLVVMPYWLWRVRSRRSRRIVEPVVDPLRAPVHGRVQEVVAMTAGSAVP